MTVADVFWRLAFAFCYPHVLAVSALLSVSSSTSNSSSSVSSAVLHAVLTDGLCIGIAP